MNMVRVKTAELSGAALDWAVALATGASVRVLPQDNPEERWQVQRAGFPGGPYWPSSDWSQGGPLIEKFNVEFTFERAELIFAEPCKDDGLYHESFSGMYGKGYLIAACRAIVAAKLGDTVEVPKELMP